MFNFKTGNCIHLVQSSMKWFAYTVDQINVSVTFEKIQPLGQVELGGHGFLGIERGGGDAANSNRVL